MLSCGLFFPNAFWQERKPFSPKAQFLAADNHPQFQGLFMIFDKLPDIILVTKPNFTNVPIDIQILASLPVPTANQMSPMVLGHTFFF